MEQPVDELKTEFSKLFEDSKEFIKMLKSLSTQAEVDETYATLQYLNQKYDFLENQSKQILTKKSYLTNSEGGKLIILNRKTRREVDDARWYFKNIDLEKIKERKEKKKQEDEALNKLFKVGQTFKLKYRLYTITKVTPSMIKYKECDSICIEKGEEYGGYVTSKYMILNEELQKYNEKKEHGITKNKLDIFNFSDEKGTIYKFGVPYVYTMDFGN